MVENLYKLTDAKLVTKGQIYDALELVDLCAAGYIAYSFAELWYVF